MYYALDISKWQGSYNAKTAKAQGVNTVVLRAAYASNQDVKFDDFYAIAKMAGQTVGAYGFATWHYRSQNGSNIAQARKVMIAQTNAWIAICKDKLDGYFAIDQELENGSVMGLTPAENEVLLNECIALLEAAGFVVCIYCSAAWAMTQFNKDKVNADLWLAYYYADPFDPDFDAVANYKTAQGIYFDYMRSCGDQLMGWQFGRIGYGAKYGVGSVNVDRNLFYKTPAQGDDDVPPGEEKPSPDEKPIPASFLSIGFATPGDIATFEALLTRLYIPYETMNGYIRTLVAVTSGDIITIEALCEALQVPCVRLGA